MLVLVSEQGLPKPIYNKVGNFEHEDDLEAVHWLTDVDYEYIFPCLWDARNHELISYGTVFSTKYLIDHDSLVEQKMTECGRWYIFEVEQIGRIDG